jgi:hypothetical protein
VTRDYAIDVAIGWRYRRKVWFAVDYLPENREEERGRGHRIVRPVTDLDRLRGLTQLPRRTSSACFKPLNRNVIDEETSTPPACAIIKRSQTVDSKRRDVRVVEGARLEIDSGRAQ